MSEAIGIRGTLVDRIWNFFASPAVTLGLLFALAAALAADALVELPAVLLSLNLIACAIERFPHALADHGAGPARFGPWLIQAGLLVVVGGAGLAQRFAFEGMAELNQGGGANGYLAYRERDGSEGRRPIGFFVALDDFRAQALEGQGPRWSEADLVIRTDAGGMPGPELLRETVAPDRPLAVGGATLQVAAYRRLEAAARARVVILDATNGARHDRLLARGDSIDAAGARYTLLSHSAAQNAIELQRTRDGRSETLSLPASARGAGGDLRDGRARLSFHGLQPLYAVDLRVARGHVGIVACLGALLALAGVLLLAFPVRPRSG